jgi:outer membrane protein
VPVAMVSERADELLALARSKRPDLAAAEARVLAAEAHVKSVRAEGRPTLETNLTAGDNYYTRTSAGPYTYAASLGFRLPIFTGGSHAADVAQAQAEADEARARLDDERKGAASRAWADYTALKTAVRRYEAATALLDEAKQSHDVARERYEAGVASILDVLAARSALENARALVVGARSDWHVALAQLAHDTGTLALEAPRSAAPSLGQSTVATPEKSTP